MSTTSPSPDDGRGQVPGWAETHPEDLERLDDLEDPPPPAPASPSLPSSGPRPSNQPAGPLDGEPAATSIPGSPPTDDDDLLEPGAEISSYLADELEELGASVFDVAGRAANRLYCRRTRTQSRLWLATDEEAAAFGAAAARIMNRHIPDELAEDGDVSDALVMGSVAFGYVLRNTAGQEAPAPEGPGPVAYETPPAPAPAPGPADTSPAAAGPAPIVPAPSVLTPDL
jgi:hypothetical protein